MSAPLSLDQAWLEGQADAIRRLASQGARDIIDIGQRLIAVKDRLPHGDFTPWLDREFGWTDRTARNFMSVARAFGDKTEIVSGFDAGALYALASGNVPEEVIEHALIRGASGERVTTREVKAAIAATKPAPVEQRATPVLAPTFATAEQPASASATRPPIVRQRLTDDSPDYDHGDGWTDAPVPIRRESPSEPTAESLALVGAMTDDQVTAWNDGVRAAVLPHVLGEKLADALTRLYAARRILRDIPLNDLVERNGESEIREQLERVVALATDVLAFGRQASGMDAPKLRSVQ